MEAIVLAGGLGTRLRSMVNDVPKCMAPVAGKPFLWYLLTYLKHYNVDHVILSVGYLRECIYEWIDTVRDEFPFTIDYAVEEQPLGTGGGIRLALEQAHDDSVFVVNGDTFFDVNLDILYDAHRIGHKPITLALKPMRHFDRYGRVDMNQATGTILAFCEKKPCEEGLINGGVYVINRESDVFDHLPERFSFEQMVLEPQCARENLLGVVQNGYFIDIGIPEDYTRAQTELPVQL